MEHSVSEIVEIFDIHRSTVSRVYLECLIEGIVIQCGQRSNQPRILNDRDQKRLIRIAIG